MYLLYFYKLQHEHDNVTLKPIWMKESNLRKNFWPRHKALILLFEISKVKSTLSLSTWVAMATHRPPKMELLGWIWIWLSYLFCDPMSRVLYLYFYACHVSIVGFVQDTNTMAKCRQFHVQFKYRTDQGQFTFMNICRTSHFFYLCVMYHLCIHYLFMFVFVYLECLSALIEETKCQFHLIAINWQRVIIIL